MRYYNLISFVFGGACKKKKTRTQTRQRRRKQKQKSIKHYSSQKCISAFAHQNDEKDRHRFVEKPTGE